MMKRRSFIKKSIVLSTVLSSGMLYSCRDKSDSLKILVLGGTDFVGPAIVNQALMHNHDVTLFNRGITNPELFPDLRLIKGDREKGEAAYEPLLNENWDVIIDVWPQKYKLVKEAASALVQQAKHYVFISSIAVYNNFQEVGLHEDSDVVNLDIDQSEWTYSEEKLAAENVVKKLFPENHTILRPGPITGDRDPALDLLYWCIKLNRDESIIAPGSGIDPLQFIDVKDVAKFAISASENKLPGIYNLIGPSKDVLLWKDFLELAKTHFKSNTELVWASEEFLKDNQVHSFSDLPLWAPLSEERGFAQISNGKLAETGFEFTPIESTLDDCLKWHQANMKDAILFGTEDVATGLERSREKKLIGEIAG